MEKTALIGVCFKALFLRVKVYWVYLKPDKIQPCFIGCNAAAPAPQVGVYDFVTLFRVVPEYPGVERYRLLRRVYAVRVCSDASKIWIVKTARRLF